MDKAGIALTDRAAAHVKNYLAKHGGAFGLRIGIRPTGCSGYRYVIDAATAASDNDLTFASKGINIVVDKLSLPYLTGTELDFIREGLNESFHFNNPNVKETCGCGESFSVAEDST